MMNKQCVGSSFDDFLKEEEIEAEVTANAVKRVLAWQLLQLMEQKKITKTMMAERMNTSRASLNRLLDPNSVVSHNSSLQSQSKVTGFFPLLILISRDASFC